MANAVFCHHGVAGLWPVGRSLPPFDRLLAGEVNRITVNGHMGPVFTQTALNTRQGPHYSTMCDEDKIKLNTTVCS